MNDWKTQLPWPILREVSIKERLPLKLIASLCMVESGGNQFATRYEPDFKYLVNVKEWAKEHGISINSEEMLQKTSWGLMQIMGGTARYCGFEGPIPQLCDPYLNIKYAGNLIKKLATKYQKQEDIVAAYNAGSAIMTVDGKYKNESYVVKVMSYFRDL